MFIIFIFAFKLAARQQPLGNWSVTVGVEWACQPVLLVSCRHRTATDTEARRGESASRLGSLSGSVCISCGVVFLVLSLSRCCCGYFKAWHCVVCCLLLASRKFQGLPGRAPSYNCQSHGKCQMDRKELPLLWLPLFSFGFSQKITRQFKCEKRCGQHKQRSATVCLCLFSAGVEVAQKPK